MKHRVTQQDIEAFFEGFSRDHRPSPFVIGEATRKAAHVLGVGGSGPKIIKHMVYLGIVGRFDVWQAAADHQTHGDARGERYATLIFDRENHEVAGYLLVKDMHDWGDRFGRGDLDVYMSIVKKCVDDFSDLAAKYPSISTERVAVVLFSRVEQEYLNLGVGTLLYIVGAAAARARHVALIAEVCVDGTTSSAAKRVWRSRLFSSFVSVGRFSSFTGVFSRRYPLKSLNP